MPAHRPVGKVRMKKCSKCRKTLPISEFNRNSSRKGGRDAYCHSCRHSWVEQNQAKMRTYRRDHYHRRAANGWKPPVRKYRAPRDPLKKAAKNAVDAAINRGDLVRPERCSQCGSTDRIQAHHPDYTKPLEIVWLCTPCHGKTWRKDQALEKQQAERDGK